MSAGLEPMRLNVARARAEKVVAWLAPFCERIEVAGSIRRERPLCNDIDLVVIPKFEERAVKVDMFTESTVKVNALREHLLAYVRGSQGEISDRQSAIGNSQAAAGEPAVAKAMAGKAYWKGRGGQPGPEPREDGRNLLLVTAAGVQLDVWCASAANWTTLLICRTGSMLHNVWAAQRAKDLGGHWQPYEGLTLRGELLR